MDSQQVVTWNRALKLAIFDSGETQTKIGRRARIRKWRMSRLTRGHVRATERERKALARVLHRPEHELFPDAVSA